MRQDNMRNYMTTNIIHYPQIPISLQYKTITAGWLEVPQYHTVIGDLCLHPRQMKNFGNPIQTCA